MGDSWIVVEARWGVLGFLVMLGMRLVSHGGGHEAG